jgi:hypothetical protein
MGEPANDLSVGERFVDGRGGAGSGVVGIAVSERQKQKRITKGTKINHERNL